MDPESNNDEVKPADPQQKQKQPSKSGYGKRPLWQWVVIYLVVAIIVYYAIYLLFFNHGGGTPGY